MGKAEKLIASAREFELSTKWWKDVKPSSLRKTGVSEALRQYEKALQEAPKAKGTEARTDAYMAVISSLKELIDPLRKAQTGLKKMKKQQPLLNLVEKVLTKIYAEKHSEIVDYKSKIQDMVHVPKSIPVSWIVDRDNKWLMKLFDMDDMMNDREVRVLVAIIGHISMQSSKALQAAQRIKVTSDSSKGDMTAKFFHLSQLAGGVHTKKEEFKKISKSLADKFSVKKNLAAALANYWKKVEALLIRLIKMTAKDYNDAKRLAASGQTEYASCANYHLQRATLLAKVFPAIRDGGNKVVEASNGVSSLKAAA